MTRNVPAANETKVIESSGNVFADLGVPEPEMELAKAKLAIAIAQVIEDQRLTQEAAGRITGLDQPRISEIMRGRLRGFSLDRLFRALNALGQDVEVFVHGADTVGEAQLKVTVDLIPK